MSSWQIPPLFAGRGFGALRFSYMTRVIPCVLAIFSVLALGLAWRPARAEPANSKATPVYVLSIWTEDADDQAEALTQALRAQVRLVPGWSLLETSHSFETLVIALKCPPKPDLACLQRIGDQLKADHYVWGAMDKTRAPVDHVAIDLHMWARGKGDIVVTTRYRDNLKDPTEEALRTVAADLLGRLTGGAPLPSTLAGGPQTPPFAGAAPPTPVHPVTGSDSPFPTRRVLAYTAVALGAALFVASAVEAATWISDSNRSTDDRERVPRTVTDVCADSIDPAARDACNRGRDAVTASTLGWVFAGAGAALVGTGVWLILADHGAAGESDDHAPRASSGSRFQLLPSLGARAGSVRLRVTF
ncbi:MAG: hypothetical protein M3O46_13635 [Myxococcota bacterium]|nr:hypothetical protein [Myxococcota bacterium]